MLFNILVCEADKKNLDLHSLKPELIYIVL
jgi:hypothetical protein